MPKVTKLPKLPLSLSLELDFNVDVAIMFLAAHKATSLVKA